MQQFVSQCSAAHWLGPAAIFSHVAELRHLFTVFEGMPVRVCMFIAERAMVVPPADTCVTELDCLFPAAFCAVLCPSLHATRHAHASRTSPLRGCLWHPLRCWWPLLQCAGYLRHEFPLNAGEEGHLPRHESESRGFERGAYAGGGCTLRAPPPRAAHEAHVSGPPPNAHAPQLQRTARSMFKPPPRITCGHPLGRRWVSRGPFQCRCGQLCARSPRPRTLVSRPLPAASSAPRPARRPWTTLAQTCLRACVREAPG